MTIVRSRQTTYQFLLSSRFQSAPRRDLGKSGVRSHERLYGTTIGMSAERAKASRPDGL